MKFLRFLVLFFLLISTFTSKVLAADQAFYSTIALSINEIATEGLEYDEENIKGIYRNNLINTVKIGDLTTDEYRTRIYNLHQYVAGPPYSKIDVVYFWYNNTPETVNVENIRIPLSRQTIYKGDVTNVLEDIGFERDITCTNSICKGGKYLEVDGVGLLSSNISQDPPKGVSIATLTIKPPIEITEYEIQYMSEYTSKLRMHIRNNTGEYLNNVDINYVGNIDQPIELQAHQEIDLTVYKRCLLSENQINCGSVRIKDPNTKVECMLFGSPWGKYNVSDSITVFNKIEGEWVSGAQVQPNMESFYIQRLPYKYTTPDMIAYIDPPEPEVTLDEYWKELLDIDTLPITSYGVRQFNYFLRLLKPLRIDTL